MRRYVLVNSKQTSFVVQIHFLSKLSDNSVIY